MFVVTVYEQNRAYGGQEEGGWWYDTGELTTEPELTKLTKLFEDEEGAYAYCRELNAGDVLAEWNDGYTHDITSVCCEVHYGAETWEWPCPAFYPEARPRYE